jgi:hypothetical protein
MRANPSKGNRCMDEGRLKARWYWSGCAGLQKLAGAYARSLSTNLGAPSRAHGLLARPRAPPGTFRSRRVYAHACAPGPGRWFAV